MQASIRLLRQVTAIRSELEGHTEIYPKLFAGESGRWRAFPDLFTGKHCGVPIGPSALVAGLISGIYPMTTASFGEHAA